MSSTNEPKSIAVIGAGLAGCMIAALLADLSFAVTVFEKREETPLITSEEDKTNSEFGNATNAIKRSINLALSHRGILALERLSLVQEVMKTAIPMPQRVIHTLDGQQTTQPYGRPGQSLYSVSRGGLNALLQRHFQQSNTHANNSNTNSNTAQKKKKMHFGYALKHVDREGTCTFTTPDGSTHTESFDLVIGADGAFSAVRESILKQGRINFMRKFVRHGYKELTIPPVRANPNDPSSPLQFALSEHEGLHIWPRGDFMLIALPNPDKSFTATLFAPFTGPGGFDNIDLQDEKAIESYFRKNFPDAIQLMPDVVKDFQTNPVGSLVTLKLDPWNFGKVVLIGDAAHAVVPFFGQGMNAAFQDATMLIDCIEEALRFQTRSNIDFGPIIAKFAKERQPSTDALSDICLEHYHDMASNTASSVYLFKKKVESWLNYLMPQTFVPFYTMMAFTSMPYHHALARNALQEKWVSYLCLGSLAGLVTGGALLLNSRESASKSILSALSPLKKFF